MDRITHKISLDTSKNGVQKILQGFNVGDQVARRIEIALTNGGVSVPLADTGITALMYVTVDGIASVNAVTIEEGKAIYDVDANDTATSGIVDMNLKILDTVTGMVLYAPRFQLEVWENGIGSSTAATSPTFTALESALAQAQLYSQKTIKSVTLEEDDNIFRVEYMDGSTYESSVIADALVQIGDVESYVTRAEEAKASAEASENNALASELASKISEDSAKASELNAKASENIVTASEQVVTAAEANVIALEALTKGYKDSVTASEINAKASEQNAYDYSVEANNAKVSAQGYEATALTHKQGAEQAETNAQTAEANAQAHEASAEAFAKTSESYAIGGTNTRAGEDTDNAKHYMEQCQQIAGGMQGGFVPMGTVSFAQLPTSGIGAGWMYNVSDEFVSDSRFKDGAGKTYAAGSNVYYTAQGEWDVLSGAIPTINGKNGNTITLGGGDIYLDGYVKGSDASDIVATDTINEALSKVQKRAQTNTKNIRTNESNIAELQKKTIFFGVSSESASASARTVTVDSSFSYTDGTLVCVKFGNACEASTVTLNVNGLGAKNIYDYSGHTVSGANYGRLWVMGERVLFIYDETKDGFFIFGKNKAGAAEYGIVRMTDELNDNTSGPTATAIRATRALAIATIGTIPNYSSSKTYDVGDVCYYGGIVRECISAITTAEAWNTAHWRDVTSLADKISANASALADLTPISLTATISAGSTSATFTDSRIVASTAKVDVYFKDKVLAPTSVSTTDGSITVEIDAQDTDTEVLVCVGKGV